jgi:carbamate kinase
MPIKEINLESLRLLLPRLEAGTIRPKIKACINFIENGGKEAYIGNVFMLNEIMGGRTGTRITR